MRLLFAVLLTLTLLTLARPTDAALSKVEQMEFVAKGVSFVVHQKEQVFRERLSAAISHLNQKVSDFHRHQHQAFMEQATASPEACFKLIQDIAGNPVCNQTLSSIGNLDQTSAAHVPALCASGCLDPLKQYFTQCMPTVPGAGSGAGAGIFSIIVPMLNLMCKSFPPDSELCGVVMVNDERCSNVTNGDKDTCQGRAGCRYWARTGECQPSPNILCHPCLQEFTRLLSSIMPTEQSFIDSMSDFICYRAPGGEYCLDVFEGFADNATQVLSSIQNPMIDGICRNLTQRVCWAKLTAGVSRVREYTATEALSTCLQWQVFPSGIQDCVDSWRYSMYHAWTISRATDILCLANTVGKYCGQVVAATTQAEKNCFYMAKNYNQCSQSCDAIANSTVSSLGCCIGYMAEVSSEVLPPVFARMLPDSIPHWRIATVKPTPRPAGALTNVLEAYSVCPSTKNISQILNETCPLIRSALKAKRTLALRLRWNFLALNQTLATLINNSLLVDLATAVGLSVDDLVSFNVSEDPSIQLPVSSGTSGRSYAIQAGSGSSAAATTSGTQVTLEFQTTADNYTEGLAQSFDRSVSDQTLALTGTQATLQGNCPDCAQGADGSLVVPTPASPPSPPASSSGSNGGMIAGIVIGCIAFVVLVAVIIVVVIRRKAAREDGGYSKVDDELR